MYSLYQEKLLSARASVSEKYHGTQTSAPVNQYTRNSTAARAHAPYYKILHEWLEKAGITLLYYKNIHAKIIIIDNALAVVSSMNFIKNATAGTSWEAGMVTIDQEVVDSIKASITARAPSYSSA